ncbi:hypothetical protein [Streptomyces cylindrosporus]|uniref:Uncharacterized protein n=1 Tax=Streptomyces cylindrosporus TaxID=2927583 RepID=A0ABS9Y1G4_9ACTN|nr:hypothetical protein [Streptomyces cylindrosporus]MCI3271054.1 hypothetical protein [Streptomyces cylindrosporus]
MAIMRITKAQTLALAGAFEGSGPQTVVKADREQLKLRWVIAWGSGHGTRNALLRMGLTERVKVGHNVYDVLTGRGLNLANYLMKGGQLRAFDPVLIDLGQMPSQ